MPISKNRLLGYLLAFLAAVVAAIAHNLTGRGPSQDQRPGEQVTGRARLIDGDSLRIGSHEIRLVGIDAPEGRQRCDLSGRDWRCGEEARRRLERLIDNRKLDCEVEDIDRHDRLLAVCRVAGTDVNAWMVQQGWAVAYGRRYMSEEDAARKARRGIWQSRFDYPRDWRERNMRSQGSAG